MSGKFPNLKINNVQRMRLFEEEPKSTLTAGEITRLSWARLLEKINEVPPIFRDRFRSITDQSGLFPYTVLTPTYEGFLKRENLKLILIQGTTIIVMERVRDRLTETEYYLQDINLMEVGDILLNGWLRIHGLNQDNELKICTLKFNAVTDWLFLPFIDAYRCASSSGLTSDIREQQDKFRILQEVNFKYMNFARRSLISGDLIEGFVFQPEVQIPLVRVGGMTIFHRVLCYSQLLILTNHEFILIRDDSKSQHISTDTRYGGIWTYIPRRRIKETEIFPSGHGISKLRLRLPYDDYIEISFEQEKTQEIEKFFQRIEFAR